ARADFRNQGPIGDLERVHDLFGPVPLLAIGALEHAEIQRREKALARFLSPLGKRSGMGGIGRKGKQNEQRQHASHRFPALPVRPASPAPTIPPLVIALTERISSSFPASRSFRSSTRSRIERPVVTEAFAISAV